MCAIEKTTGGTCFRHSWIQDSVSVWCHHFQALRERKGAGASATSQVQAWWGSVHAFLFGLTSEVRQ